MTTPTTTAQATVLSEEQLDRIWERLSVLSDVERTNQILTDLLALSRHTEALTEQVRVLAEAMSAIVTEATPTDYPESNITVYTILDEYIDRARSALAALEGSGEK